MASILSSLGSGVGDFVSRRRRPLTVLAGLAGGAYMVASYARSKLEDLQDGLGKQRASRENLRRRFQQNQEDCGFTVLALLPSLGTQILEGMDVEALSARLASLGKAKPKPSPDATPPPVEPGSTPLINGTDQKLDPTAAPFSPSAPAEPAQAQVNGGVEEEKMPTDANAIPSIPSHFDLSSVQSPKLSAPPPLPHNLDASTASLATPTASAFLPAKPANGFEALEAPIPQVRLDSVSPQLNGISPPGPAAPDAATSKGKARLDAMTKADVWAELKTLSFARLLTATYCLALLTLQTHVQLNLLGRYAYVSSVLAMAEEEDVNVQLLDGVDDARLRPVDLRTERRYLTFSWWLLHRGWEEVALRVREKVDQVVGPMGLRDALSEKDLKRLIDEVRRKIEYEDDGSPFSFSAALFPPTTVSELETLRAGGMPPHDCVVDPPLRDLLDETADFIDAPDFPRVLSACVGKVLELVLQKVGNEAGLAPTEEEIATAAAAAAADGGDAPFIHPRLRFQELANGQDDGKKARLANLIPIVSRQAHLVLNGLPNECAEVGPPRY